MGSYDAGRVIDRSGQPMSPPTDLATHDGLHLPCVGLFSFPIHGQGNQGAERVVQVGTTQMQQTSRCAHGGQSIHSIAPRSPPCPPTSHPLLVWQVHCFQGQGRHVLALARHQGGKVQERRCVRACLESFSGRSTLHAGAFPWVSISRTPMSFAQRPGSSLRACSWGCGPRGLSIPRPSREQTAPRRGPGGHEEGRSVAADGSGRDGRARSDAGPVDQLGSKWVGLGEGVGDVWWALTAGYNNHVAQVAWRKRPL